MYIKDKKTGFTLIELLVVIAIVAVLLSILTPALNRSRVSAKRVLCAARLRQLLIGASTYAAEDSSGRLPRGGIQHTPAWAAGMQYGGGPSKSVFPPPPTPPENLPEGFVIDDATEMTASDYFNLGAAATGQPGGFGQPMSIESVEQAARRIHQNALQKLFVCPEAEGRGDLFTSHLPLFRGQPQYRPAIVQFGSAPQSPWVVRLGYLYFGGFDTRQWAEPRASVRRYRAPVKSSDPGGLVLMSDPLWYLPALQKIVIPHTMRGYREGTPQGPSSDDVRLTFGRAGTTLGRLDGSVEYKPLDLLDWRAAYCENGDYTVDLRTLF